jgi:DNA repair photolyase
MPGINDSPELVEEIVSIAEEAGATFVNGIALHLRPGVKEVFMPWLEDNYPELVGGYSERYSRSAYVGKVTEGTVRATVQEMVADAGGLKRQHPHRGPRARGDGSRRDHLESIEQLSLL